MKSSDLKVVAIILSIALFFTIITSNAVSIASVVILAKGGTGAVQTVAPGTGDVQQGTQATPGGTTSTTPGGTTQQGGTTQTTPDANKPADNAGNADASNDPILKDPLGAYQKAAKEINQKGAAGYNKIGWQKILKIEGLGMLDGAVTKIIGGFMTEESEAEVKANAKGSDDSKNRMPPSDCSKSCVKSATAKKEGELYIVTIVMNEQVNPSYQDTDGLVKMSKEFLDMKDVLKEAANISIVKSLEGEIRYTDYTITATLNSKGQFVDITHKGVGYIKANLNGSINASGELEFNAKYYDFQY